MFKRFRQKVVEPTPVKDIIFKVEFSHTMDRGNGDLADLYVIYWNSKTEEMVSLAVPHGRLDIAQLIQERING